jgi:hypothetical protein
MMLARCISVVRVEMKSSFAISWFVWPRATSRRTSSWPGGCSATGRQRSAELRMNVTRSGRYRFHSCDEVRVRGAFDRVPGGAGLERPLDCSGFSARRQHQHLALGRDLAQLRDELDSAFPRQEHIEDDHVRLVGARHDDCALLGSGLTDDAYSGCPVEHEPDAGADDRVVVDKQDARIHERNARPGVRPEQ